MRYARNRGRSFLSNQNLIFAHNISRCGKTLRPGEVDLLAGFPRCLTWKLNAEKRPILRPTKHSFDETV